MPESLSSILEPRGGASSMDKILAVVAVSLGCINASAQRVEATLDHVVIAVHDLDAAGRLYSTLGFTVVPGGRHPGGTQNSIVPFSSGGYLELVTPYDATMAGGKSIAELLKQGEGAVSAGLQTASAENAARNLKTAGLRVNGPTAGTIMRPWETQAPPRWWTVGFENPMASRPVFLIQYIRDPASPAMPRPAHPNSACSLSALLIAVSDQEKSMAAYGNIGEARNREISLPEFGATAKELVLEGGSILLLRATDPAGATARRLKEKGEGIIAVRIGVTDADRARDLIAGRNVSADRQSILVSPETAAGIWLQFQSAK
jgi:catechol 2,3-dioxygenase-like lactoylglutathione lyase family enzyme